MQQLKVSRVCLDVRRDDFIEAKRTREGEWSRWTRRPSWTTERMLGEGAMHSRKQKSYCQPFKNR